MRTVTGVKPTGQERTFGMEEIIVSKTDAKGVITYANDVFLRLARYDEGEVIGQPHNLIRHPQMPRGVFHLLWHTISSGQEIFAYIDNLAADGANYWVLAHVTPTKDAHGRLTGYHSNRRCPERSAVTHVRDVYARMLAHEERHGGGRDAAASSAQLLLDELNEGGRSYEDFVWDLIQSVPAEQAPCAR